MSGLTEDEQRAIADFEALERENAQLRAELSERYALSELQREAIRCFDDLKARAEDAEYWCRQIRRHDEGEYTEPRDAYRTFGKFAERYQEEKARAERAEADCAVLREALERAEVYIHREPRQDEALESCIRQALASITAGACVLAVVEAARELLEHGWIVTPLGNREYRVDAKYIDRIRSEVNALNAATQQEASPPVQSEGEA